MNRLSFFLFLLACSGVAAFGQCPSTLQVGARGVTVGGRSIALWYPTTATESTFAYGSKISGSAATNAAPATCAKFPVIIFSHGYHGCNVASAQFTETMARRGYIVAAPNHRDNTCSTEGGAGTEVAFTEPEKFTDATYVDRRDDVKATLDWVLTGSEFSAVADASRVGIFGHSLGGYTAIGVTGGWPSWRDSRYKAALLLSPYLQPYLIDNRIAGMRVPALYQGGTLDGQITPYVDGTKGDAYGLTGAPKLYLSLARATHLEWTISACSRVSTTIAGCISGDANTRMAVDYAVNFMDRFVAGIDRSALWTRQNGLAEFRRLSLTSSVSAASYKDSNLATDSIAAAFGDAFSTATLGASSTPLPTALGGVSVSLEDSARRTQLAPLFFVSPRQVNYLLPSTIAAGPVTVTVRNGTEVVSTGTLTAMPVMPALFSAAGDGRGVPAAQSLLVKADGTRDLDLVYNPNTLAPIALDPRAGELYVILYGTGFRRGVTSTARVGNVTVPVLGISSTPGFFGLDQIAIGPIPGGTPSGTSDVIISVEGQTANTVSLTFR